MGLLAEDKKISVACDANQPVFVEGDSARLKQVVVNLLDNAIKYTQEGGAIHLRVRRLMAVPFWKWKTTAVEFSAKRCRMFLNDFIG